jgi:nucleotide-binding universal stress UspA family protein
MYERIILAYDGSREGLIALREGALLARTCGAKVYLLSVLPLAESSASTPVADGGYGGAVAQHVDTYHALLNRGVEVLRQLGFDPVARLVVGEPAPQIGAFAKEIGADLVVLGHRRRSFLERWWSGGTGGYVTEHVQCSVLIGRNPVSDEAFDAELREAKAAGKATQA